MDRGYADGSAILTGWAALNCVRFRNRQHDPSVTTYLESFRRDLPRVLIGKVRSQTSLCQRASACTHPEALGLAHFRWASMKASGRVATGWVGPTGDPAVTGT